MDSVLNGAGAAVVVGPWPDVVDDMTMFTRDNLGKVCTLVRSAGLQVRLAHGVVEDLLIAVGEIAINAIRYAGGSGSITLRPLPRELMTEIRDDGPGLPDALVSGTLPTDGGLWRARLLCHRLDVFSSASGVTVRIYTTYGGLR